jgi:PKD repeat protein
MMKGLVYPYRKGFSLVLVGLLITALVFVAPVAAAVIIINPGDSINTAINNAAGGDTIILNPGTYSENGIVVNKNIILRADTANGHGPADTIIDGKSTSPRIFTVSGGYSLIIDHLHLQNGRAVNGTEGTEGGGVGGPGSAGENGGAIASDGPVTVNSSMITGCSAGNGGHGGNGHGDLGDGGNGGAGGSGGAIYSTGTVNITDTIITGCLAGKGGNGGNAYGFFSGGGNGGAGGSGGAIYSTGTVNITDTVITGCSAGDGGAAGSGDYEIGSAGDSGTGGSGGAIYSTDTVTVTTSTFSGCSAGSSGDGGSGTGSGVGSGGSGGAIYSTDIVTVTTSTFSGCSAGDGGIGGWSSFGGGEGGSGGSGGAVSGTVVTLTSSTITGCSAGDGGEGGSGGSGGSGGAVSGTTVTLTSSTITGCSAGDGGVGVWDGQLGYYAGSGGSGGAVSGTTVTATSSTITGCSAGDGGDNEGAGYDGSGGSGGAVSGTTVTLTSSTITGCSAGSGGSGGLGPDGHGGAVHGSGTIQFCRLVNDNVGTAVSGTGAGITATDNWWGSNGDPVVNTTGTVISSPWLMLGITASPASITMAQTSIIRANLTFDSAGMDTKAVGTVQNGIPVAFEATGSGSVSPESTSISAGTASTLFTPATAGLGQIKTTVDGQSVFTSVVVSAVTPAPTITGIQPAFGKRGTLVPITNLSGTGFKAGAKVYLTKTGSTTLTATNVTVVSAKKITCTVKIPAGAVIGPWNVKVMNTDGQSGTKANAFMVKTPVPPTVTGITPASGKKGQTIQISNLAGTGFVASPKPAVKFLKGTAVISATNVTVVSTKKITCTVVIPVGAATGPWNVRVVNADGQYGTLTSGFNITGLPAPVASFTANITSGPAPLTVKFTDLSSNSPAGWAWFFGDETYTAPWTQRTAGAGWSARYDFNAVALPDRSIVLTGGYDGSSLKNDVWRSADQGATWTRQTASAGWSARYLHASVALPDGSIVMMGGNDSIGYKNDVWRSMDQGATWTRQTAGAGWSKRMAHSSIVLPDGSIVLMGGYDGSSNKNDVWRSTDQGATWTQQTASSVRWSARRGQTSVVLPDSSIVVMGGYDSSLRNDVWRSTDQGATWTRQTASAGWSARYWHTSVVLPDGSIVVMGGISPTGRKNDVWRSKDYGATWTQVTANAGWSARSHHVSVMLPDSSIVVMGGYDSSGRNDVWRLMPAGSSAKNPSHTYTVPGIYKVALQVYNANGYSSTPKEKYITVTSPIILTVPNGGNVWKRGSTQIIKWNYTGSPGSKVKIELLKGTAVNRVINASTSIGSVGSGSYSWIVPFNQVLGTDYKIQITSTSNAAYTDKSDANFTISA